MATAVTPSPFITGFRLIDGNELNTQFAHPKVATQDGITATAGGGKTNAFQLTTRINRVTVAATAGDSIKLNANSLGKIVIVTNDTANPIQVFGNGTDTINDVATATGISQGALTTTVYFSPLAGKWYTNGSVGANSGATKGTIVATAATPVTVANTAVTANSIITFTLKTVGGTVGAYPTIPTITPGTGFTFVATASDTSTYNYSIVG